MSVAIESINKVIVDLQRERSRIDNTIAGLQNIMEEMQTQTSADADSVTPPAPKAALPGKPKGPKSEATVSTGKKRYNVSQKDIVPVLEQAEFPLSPFLIVVELAKVNIQVLEPALLRILHLGAKSEKFHLTSGGKWSLVQND